MTLDVLVLAAFDPELAPLRALLGAAMTARVAGRIVVARTAGIGLPASAAGAAAHIAELRPRAVVLVGTCGAYAGAGLAIGDVVVVRRLRLIDTAALEGLTQFPAPMAIEMETNGPMSAALAATCTPRSSVAGALGITVATTLAITVDDAMAARIAAGSGADVEHLEAHGVAAACAAREVPFAAVLGVANFVGARGRAEWLAHHREAEAAAGERVLRWLGEGA